MKGKGSREAEEAAAAEAERQAENNIPHTHGGCRACGGVCELSHLQQILWYQHQPFCYVSEWPCSSSWRVHHLP